MILHFFSIFHTILPQTSCWRFPTPYYPCSLQLPVLCLSQKTKLNRNKQINRKKSTNIQGEGRKQSHNLNKIKHPEEHESLPCFSTASKQEAHPPCNVLDIPRVIPKEKTKYPFPSGYQERVIPWLGVELYAHFHFSILGFLTSFILYRSFVCCCSFCELLCGSVLLCGRSVPLVSSTISGS